MSDDLDLRRIALDKAIAAAPLGSADEIAAMAERFVAFLAGPKPKAPQKTKRCHRWTNAGRDMLRRIYPTETDAQAVYAAVREAESAPGLTDQQIQSRAIALGLRRPPECMTPAVRAMHAAKRAAS